MAAGGLSQLHSFLAASASSNATLPEVGPDYELVRVGVRDDGCCLYASVAQALRPDAADEAVRALKRLVYHGLSQSDAAHEALLDFLQLGHSAAAVGEQALADWAAMVHDCWRALLPREEDGSRCESAELLLAAPPPTRAELAAHLRALAGSEHDDVYASELELHELRRALLTRAGVVIVVLEQCRAERGVTVVPAGRARAVSRSLLAGGGVRVNVPPVAERAGARWAIMLLRLHGLQHFELVGVRRRVDGGGMRLVQPLRAGGAAVPGGLWDALFRPEPECIDLT